MKQQLERTRDVFDFLMEFQSRSVGNFHWFSLNRYRFSAGEGMSVDLPLLAKGDGDEGGNRGTEHRGSGAHDRSSSSSSSSSSSLRCRRRRRRRCRRRRILSSSPTFIILYWIASALTRFSWCKSRHTRPVVWILMRAVIFNMRYDQIEDDSRTDNHFLGINNSCTEQLLKLLHFPSNGRFFDEVRANPLLGEGMPILIFTN